MALGLLTAPPQVCAASPDYPTALAATPGLVGYWRFESNLNSSVGGYLGTASGNAAASGAGGGPNFVGLAGNRALQLDGDGDWLTTDLDSEVTFGDAATIIAWVYLDLQPSSAGRIFYIAGRSQSGNDLDMQIGGDDRLRFYSDYGSATEAPAALPLQHWTMVAGTFDNATNERRLYVDGSPVALSTPYAPHYANDSPFTMGSTPVFPGRFFQGRLDEVAIFDRALTPDEVQGLVRAAWQLFADGYE